MMNLFLDIMMKKNSCKYLMEIFPEVVETHVCNNKFLSLEIIDKDEMTKINEILQKYIDRKQEIMSQEIEDFNKLWEETNKNRIYEMDVEQAREVKEEFLANIEGLIDENKDNYGTWGDLDKQIQINKQDLKAIKNGLQNNKMKMGQVISPQDIIANHEKFRKEKKHNFDFLFPEKLDQHNRMMLIGDFDETIDLGYQSPEMFFTCPFFRPSNKQTMSVNWTNNLNKMFLTLGLKDLYTKRLFPLMYIDPKLSSRINYIKKEDGYKYVGKTKLNLLNKEGKETEYEVFVFKKLNRIMKVWEYFLVNYRGNFIYQPENEVVPYGEINERYKVNYVELHNIYYLTCNNLVDCLDGEKHNKHKMVMYPYRIPVSDKTKNIYVFSRIESVNAIVNKYKKITNYTSSNDTNKKIYDGYIELLNKLERKVLVKDRTKNRLFSFVDPKPTSDIIKLTTSINRKGLTQPKIQGGSVKFVENKIVQLKKMRIT